MGEDTETPDGDDTGADVSHDLAADRTTAPMSEFSATEALTGAVVALVGVAIAFGTPLLAIGI